jgi:hypothetical protein
VSALTDFILARVVEDEAEVDALLGEWGRLADGRRLERQCEAYRRIVELHTPADEATCPLCVDASGHHVTDEAHPCRTLRALASIWSDHPDYRQEWRP